MEMAFVIKIVFQIYGNMIGYTLNSLWQLGFHLEKVELGLCFTLYINKVQIKGINIVIYIIHIYMHT